jgi:hypothetical protein
MKASPEHFTRILNDRLSSHAWLEERSARLPGVHPLARDNWLLRDEAFKAQMAYKDWLIEHRRGVVLQSRPQADQAAQELLELIADNYGAARNGTSLMRSDGVQIDLTSDHPLAICGRLTQEDWCLMQAGPLTDAFAKQNPLSPTPGYKLTGGVLCFPSSWRLSDKIGRSLVSIHAPVAEFNKNISKSVERMLVAIRAEQPLWRANFLIYSDPDLHQPRGEGIPKPLDPAAPRYVRVERQSFRRLPRTGAVAFGIHSSVIEARSLSHSEYSALAILKPDLLQVKR